jgi:ribosomal protein L29
VTGRYLTDIEKLLDLRELSGRELAKILDTGETEVSRLRRGMAVSEKRKKTLIRKLKLTDAEIAEIGWEVETRV